MVDHITSATKQIWTYFKFGAKPSKLISMFDVANSRQRLRPKLCLGGFIFTLNNKIKYIKNLRELSQSQERFAHKFKRNQEKIFF